METKNYDNIPKEKFQFAKKTDFGHDKKLDTKPVSYFHDAFKRFCKNKGSVVAACIILFLILYAIIAPFCTQYNVSYNDPVFKKTLPKCSWFANTSFWDGCSKERVKKEDLTKYYAMGMETGHNAVKNQKYKELSDGTYKIRLDSYYSYGCEYKNVTIQEYESIQRYQDETGIQVIYPIVPLASRPTLDQDREDANFYFKTKIQRNERGKQYTVPVYSGDGIDDIILAYQTYEAGKDEVNFEPKYEGEVEYAVGHFADDYFSKVRIEGSEGIQEDGTTYYYGYAIGNQTGYQVRINYYEYYIYNHTYILKDGITKPSFLFGTTGNGQDIFTCLASGARFSFIFAILVAVVNMFVGAIYGAIEGYYGGKADMIMERISDILAAVPFMIVITLLKFHMQASSHVLILFIAFFLTGWIGTASTTRMQFYRFKNQEYVLAARTLGAKDRRLMWKHIFPNALGTLVTSSALVIPSMIYSETNLTYLGIINLESGSTTSVGTLLAGGQPYLRDFPHIIAFPSIFLALLMLSFNLFGNGLRDAFNPSLRGSEG